MIEYHGVKNSLQHLRNARVVNVPPGPEKVDVWAKIVVVLEKQTGLKVKDSLKDQKKFSLT